MDKIVKVDEVLTLCKLASAIGTGPAYEKWWKESLDALAYAPEPVLREDPDTKLVNALVRLIEHCGYLVGERSLHLSKSSVTFTLIASSPGAASLDTVLTKVRDFLGDESTPVWTSGAQGQVTASVSSPSKQGCLIDTVHLVAQYRHLPSSNRIIDAAMPSLRNLADNVGWIIGRGASTSVDAVLIAVPLGNNASQAELDAIIQQSTGLTRGVWSESQGQDVLTYTTPDIKLIVRVVRPSRVYPKRNGVNAHGLGMESVTEKMEAILKELHTYSPERFAQTMLELSKEADPNVVLHDECAKYIHEWACMECKTIHPKPASVNLRCPTVRCPGILLPSSYEERRLRDMVDQQIAIRSKLVSGIADLLTEVSDLPGANAKPFHETGDPK